MQNLKLPLFKEQKKKKNKLNIQEDKQRVNTSRI